MVSCAILFTFLALTFRLLSGKFDNKMNPKIDKQITKTTSISIIGVSSEIDLDTGLWAINWFDTKRKWLYNLYTLLAAPLVIKVGGGLVFKGQHLEKLAGEDNDARKILLVVKYPSANHFFDLLAFKFFLLLSVLRVMAVEKFVFGFSKRIKIERSFKDRKSKGSPCLVHHFRGNKDISIDLQNLTNAAAEKGINLAYAGTKAATLQRTVDGKGTVDVPFIMDGIIVFEGDNRSDLQVFYEREIYQQFIGNVANSYVAVFEKLA